MTKSRNVIHGVGMSKWCAGNQYIDIHWYHPLDNIIQFHWIASIRCCDLCDTIGIVFYKEFSTCNLLLGSCDSQLGTQSCKSFWQILST